MSRLRLPLAALLALASAALASAPPPRPQLPVWGMTAPQAKKVLEILEEMQALVANGSTPTYLNFLLPRGAPLRAYVRDQLAVAPADLAPGSAPTILLETHALHVLGVLWDEMDRRFEAVGYLLYVMGESAKHRELFQAAGPLRSTGGLGGPAHRALASLAKRSPAIYFEESANLLSIQDLHLLALQSLFPSLGRALKAMKAEAEPAGTDSLHVAPGDGQVLSRLSTAFTAFGAAIPAGTLGDYGKLYSYRLAGSLCWSFESRLKEYAARLDAVVTAYQAAQERAKAATSQAATEASPVSPAMAAIQALMAARRNAAAGVSAPAAAGPPPGRPSGTGALLPQALYDEFDRAKVGSLGARLRVAGDAVGAAWQAERSKARPKAPYGNLAYLARHKVWGKAIDSAFWKELDATCHQGDTEACFFGGAVLLWADRDPLSASTIFKYAAKAGHPLATAFETEALRRWSLGRGRPDLAAGKVQSPPFDLTRYLDLPEGRPGSSLRLLRLLPPVPPQPIDP